MKRTITFVLVMCMLMSNFKVSIVEAASGVGAQNWKLSGFSITHTAVTFQIDSVESAQNATLIVSSDTSDDNNINSEKVIFEIPFSIKSSTEKFTLIFPNEQYLPSGSYYISVKDSYGNTTSERSVYVDKHSYYPRYYAYPKGMEVTNYSSSSYHVSATVGFKEYEAIIEANASVFIEYPTQEIGTVIETKWWDDYGCSGMDTETVNEESISFPSIEVRRDYICFSYAGETIGEDRRMGVEVAGETYYSEYGVKGGRTTKIVTFPLISDEEATVKIWIESKNGSISEKKEYNVENCDIRNCRISCSAYLTKAVGVVKPSESYGETVTKVKTVVDDKEYSCNVNTDGSFVLEYPRRESGSEILLTYMDSHGCQYSCKETVMNAVLDEDDKITLTNIEIEHTTVSFKVKNTVGQGNATLVVKSKKSSWDDESDTQEIKLELPFTLSNSEEKYTLNFPDGKYIPQGKYCVYIKDKDGNETKEYDVRIYEHDFSVKVEAYPNGMKVENVGTSPCNVSAVIEAKKYVASVEPKSTVYIEYPSQELGTEIEILKEDGYGCSYENKETIKNEYMRMPDLEGHRSYILFSFADSSISDDQRIGVEAAGEIFYSEYGVRGDKTTRIVSYPAVLGDDAVIKVWLESKNGSVSEKYEYTVQNCDLSDCQINCDASIVRAAGTVKPGNISGEVIKKVKTVIDEKEYSCDVGADGSFLLTYPRRQDGNDVYISYVDSHGCERKKRYTVSDPFRVGYSKDECSVLALRSRTLAYVGNGIRLVAKVGNKTYFSEYGVSKDKEDSLVEVKYPIQKIGQKISIWFESRDTATSTPFEVIVRNRTYSVTVDVMTSSISGTVKQSRDCQVYVKVAGKEYKCSVKKKDYVLDDEDDYDDDMNDSLEDMEKADGSWYTEFSCKYPKQKIGKTVIVTVKDNDGYSFSKTYTISNRKPYIQIDKLDSSSTGVTGYTEGKSKVSIKVGKRKYKVKAKKNGKFYKKIKPQKPGTKVKISVTTPDGYSGSKTVKIRKAKGYIALSKTVYRTTTKVYANASSLKKGDSVKLKVGSRIYAKKIKSDKNRAKFSFKIQRASAGSKVKITLCDRFGNSKDSSASMVYYGDTIRRGMSSREALLTTWGKPIRRNDWGSFFQWVYQSGNTTLYVYIRGGRVTSIQRYNY